MKTINVIIPYLAKEAQGKELEYAIAGWKRHFLHPHKIVVVGDHHPVVDSLGITFINCPRIEGPEHDNYLPHIDHINKFKRAQEALPSSEGFIYTCDDIYAVNDFGIEEILIPKVNRWEMEGDAKSPNGWKRDMARTKELCVRNGLPVWDWVCHLPVYYKWDKLFKIWETYDCANHSAIVENLYFNTYQRNRRPILIDGESGNFKFSVLEKPNYGLLQRAFIEKIWINNSPMGYVPALTEMLERHYCFENND